MKLRNTNTQDFFIKLLIPLIFAYNADLLPLTVASAECQCPSPETGSCTDEATRNARAPQDLELQISENKFFLCYDMLVLHSQTSR